MNPIEFFSDHTFRMVFLGTSLIGLIAGSLGSFAYLRKQSLISDVVSHAALPGVLGAFWVAVAFFGDGRNMAALMVGAIVAGVAAMWCADIIARRTKLGSDAAMAIVLSTFFGLGLIIMQFGTRSGQSGQGGVHSYLFGNASTLTVSDLLTAAVVGVLGLVVLLVFGPALSARTFDPKFTEVRGLPVKLLDSIIFVLIVVATVVGLKAVGLVLMVAFVVTPPAAARQWVRTVPGLFVVSGLLGALASGAGAYLSITLGKVPTGPLIVVLLFGVLVLSLVCAPRRSVVVRAINRARLRRKLRADLGVAA
ncbi:metal ABC transporter permease [Tessaracoccus sp. OH4464_COT-324]|uniref:metal ABC transporter permease n=1 Tax=Tessaracoccus sp. OH4464_COT-324 TaxID=2491059 RepID=UPI000F644D72|nr:metal ABC transporter permease [Tessaracoccus sp. OH4464_COT-324]RRD45209.1 metal ABC transporter permease [Tessaracoccus sp. OH4464_COT-324]